MADLAPIAVFAYRRTRHLARTLDALKACSEFAQSPVFIFSDGARNEAAAADVAQVRALLQARRRANITIVEAPKNLGLAASITKGVTRLCDEFGRAIVIEDDLIVSPGTLSWFNAALDRYAAEDAIWQISAHQFPVPEFHRRDTGIFLHLTTSWGWAVWKRAWDRYDPHATGWESLKTDALLSRRFDLNGSYPYARMLIHQMEGRLDSWAIRFWWTVFGAGGMSLFPPRSLVTNIGYDETATHTSFGFLKRLVAPPAAEPVAGSFLLPVEARARREDDAAVEKAIWSAQHIVTRTAYRARAVRQRLSSFGR